MIKNLLLCFSISMVCYATTSAQTKIPKIKLTQIFGGLNSPVAMARTNDDRIFIAERSGIIKIAHKNGDILSEPFLDITDRVTSGGERGLLGLAFPERFKLDGIFYVNYTTGGNNLETVISRFRIGQDSNRAIKETEEVLLTIPQPYQNHNGGSVVFGPDGYLYIGMGDGGSGGDPFGNAQNPSVLLGKMLRIDVNGFQYSIPPDNPFINNLGYRPEIWAMGLRNPWKFTFDPDKGHMWIGDVGQGLWEEVDFEVNGFYGGANYGWKCYEGNHEYNTTDCSAMSEYTFPIFEFPHEQGGNCSITGGLVYVKDTSATLYGQYLFTDYCSGKFWSTKYHGSNQFTTQELNAAPFGGFTTFGYDDEKNIYVARENGRIYRLDTVTICSTLSIEATDSLVGCGIDQVKLRVDSIPGGHFEWTRNGNVVQGQQNSTLVVTTPGIYDVIFISDSCYAKTKNSFKLLANTSLTNISFSGLQDNYCLKGAPLVLHGIPEGGTFSGDGVVDSTFYPLQAGIGNHFITYYFEDPEGCSGFQSKFIQVNPDPEADFTTVLDSVCLNGDLITLEAEPMDGMFTGPGVSGNTFNPQVAGVGLHFLIYTYMPYLGCRDVDSIHVTVYDCAMSNHKNLVQLKAMVYPNVTNGKLFVEFDDAVILMSAHLINSDGKMVRELTESHLSSKNNYEIDCSGLPKGVYILNIDTNKGSLSRKVVKM